MFFHHKLKRNKWLHASLMLCAALSFTACEKALNINNNPNDATEVSPELVLPQAIVRTSQILLGFNDYGGRLMYFANAGGVSGWGDFITYNYSTATEAGRWADTYNNLEDFQYVINNTEGDPAQAAFFHAAWVMKAYNFINLVDMYNDVPYTEALQGKLNIQPKYDKAEDIYADLAAKLDAAVAWFKAESLPSTFTNADVLFEGDKTNWARFANTLKLKLVVKGKDKVAFASEAIDAVGVLTDDAIVQPGFTRIAGKQNPMWNRWAYSAAGQAVGTWGIQFIPTPFVLGFYDGSKIADTVRADVTFASGLSVPKNQLGDEGTPSNPSPSGLAPNSWVLRPTSGGISATNYRGIGIIKGPSAGQPILYAAEAQFLAAEAVERNLMTGNAKTHFEDGIKASYNYLYKDENGAGKATVDADTYLANYKTDNAMNPLVDYDFATTAAQKLEAIITQKYIAMNFQFGHEAWNEYRRTGYPAITGTTPVATFVSIKSQATTSDRLPTRHLYPNTEFAYNAANVPSVDKFSSKIFWAK